ncbi:hypothetical protein ACFYWN_44775 [Streptomyces sp. NPDC002917]|uniref:hypothetical protein n=1 Tax=Streptomyces sp. NPDC002917 TaxID=3364671 RepID=UPI00369AF584
MLSGGVATALVGGTGSLVMVASGYADPVVCAVVVGAPAVLVLALSRLVRRVKKTVAAAPPTHHHYYNGPVTQDSRSINTTTRGVIVNTRNQTSYSPAQHSGSGVGADRRIVCHKRSDASLAAQPALPA